MTRRPGNATAPAATDLMTVGEWAVRIHVSRRTAYRHITAGHIEPTDVGTAVQPRLRISEEAHLAFMKRRTMAAPASTRRGRR